MSDNKKEALLARKAMRDAAAADAVEALQLEALELEEKYHDSGKKLGVDFAIITTLVGNFVVRNPDFIVAKKFADAETKSVEEVVQFVSPCTLFPETMTARAVFQEHAGIAWQCAAALMKLYQADIGQKQGKS
jgi:hypothetical protein